VGVLLVVLFAATLAGLQYTSSPSFCSSCHPIVPFRDTWEGSTHAAQGVTCVDCHFEPGAVGYVKGKVYSFIKLTQWAVGRVDVKPEATKTVVGATCRHCHPDPTATFIPHQFHTEVANLACNDCHSAIVHGPELVGPERAQAAADPAFCGTCHTGDVAPILFGPLEPAGREHPGAPKTDVNIWRNIHWRVADGPAVIDGVAYDQIQPETCRACHQEPTQAKGCKSCHLARVPEYRVSTAAQRASGLPLAAFALAFGLLLLTWLLRGRRKGRVFASRGMLAVAGLIALSDIVVVYLIVRDTLVSESGSVEIGPTTVWIAYLLVSIAIVLLILFEAVILRGGQRMALLPETPEEEIYVPDHNLWLKQPEASTAVAEDEADPRYRFGALPRPGAGDDQEDRT